MSVTGIPLSAAPERFFDQQQWNKFIGFFDSRQIALARLSRPPYGLGFYEEGDPGLPAPGAARVQKVEEAFQLGTNLVGSLKTKLIKRTIVATGVPLPSGERATISSADWKRLWPKFVDETAYGERFGFSEIRLHAKTVGKASIAELAEWLKGRANADKSKKEPLYSEAKNHFGARLRTRSFDKAYTKIFHRRRGRPPKA